MTPPILLLCVVYFLKKITFIEEKNSEFHKKPYKIHKRVLWFDGPPRPKIGQSQVSGKHTYIIFLSFNQFKKSVPADARGGGRQGDKTPPPPPRVVENSTQAFGKSQSGLGSPGVLENSTQVFGKSNLGFWKTTKFARTVRLYFLS